MALMTMNDHGLCRDAYTLATSAQLTTVNDSLICNIINFTFNTTVVHLPLYSLPVKQLG